MVWTVPHTLESSDVWTSADWNTYVRDNQNETIPATLTAALQYAVSDGNHNLVARSAADATTATSDTTSSTSYTDLSLGAGPSVTRDTGTRALVFYSAQMANGPTTDSLQTRISVAVSGATTLSANDEWCALLDGVAANNTNRFGMAHLFDNLTAGSNTFTMKYRVGGGTGTYVNRHIIVVPF